MLLLTWSYFWFPFVGPCFSTESHGLSAMGNVISWQAESLCVHCTVAARGRWAKYRYKTAYVYLCGAFKAQGQTIDYHKSTCVGHTTFHCTFRRCDESHHTLSHSCLDQYVQLVSIFLCVSRDVHCM